MTPETRKQFMIEYLKLKVGEQDWHGVADAAMDLREIEVELKLKNNPGIIFYETSTKITKSDLGDA